MLSIQNVDFSYGNQRIFDDLNLELEAGGFCFLIGRSGAGKSTLLQMIYMNIQPHAGTVSVANYDSTSIRRKELPFLRRKLGIIFQDYKLLKDRNVSENLSFVLEVTNTSGKVIKQRINDALTEVGLSHRRYSMPHELSGGEQQRIAIARAIINEPVLLLADEPTGNLDPETSGEIVDVLKKINSHGTAVLFATHNYEIVRNHPAKIIRLEEGKAIKIKLKQKDQTTSI